MTRRTVQKGARDQSARSPSASTRIHVLADDLSPGSFQLLASLEGFRATEDSTAEIEGPGDDDEFSDEIDEDDEFSDEEFDDSDDLEGDFDEDDEFESDDDLDDDEDEDDFEDEEGFDEDSDLDEGDGDEIAGEPGAEAPQEFESDDADAERGDRE